MCVGTGKEITMQPYDKTSPFQQWVVSNGQLRSVVEARRVLQLKPGSVFTKTSVVAVDNVSPANQHLWFFDYIPHHHVTFKCVHFVFVVGGIKHCCNRSVCLSFSSMPLAQKWFVVGLWIL